MCELDDNTIVASVLRGDRDAYRYIVERHQRRIFYIGMKFFRGASEAEDFAQEVFVRAYEKLALFSGKVPLSAWLYRLAYNVAVNRYHMRKKDLLAVAEDRIDGEAAEARDERDTPEEAAVRKEFAAALRDKLRELPPVYQVVIRMHYFEGYPYRRISRILEVPVNTLKSYVFRAKRILERKLRPYV